MAGILANKGGIINVIKAIPAKWGVSQAAVFVY